MLGHVAATIHIEQDHTRVPDKTKVPTDNHTGPDNAGEWLLVLRLRSSHLRELFGTFVKCTIASFAHTSEQPFLLRGPEPMSYGFAPTMRSDA